VEAWRRSRRLEIHWKYVGDTLEIHWRYIGNTLEIHTRYSVVGVCGTFAVGNSVEDCYAVSVRING
jgi:hypothetical protein